MTALWTTGDRRVLGRLFDGAPPDHEAAFALTREVARRLARAIPSTHRGIDLVPLLEHKLAGYNADLFAHAVRLLRADRAAAEFLARARVRRAVFPMSDMYLAEHCVGERLRAGGGGFWARRDDVRSGAVLSQRYRPRCVSPGYEPFEIKLDAPADRVEPPADPTPPTDPGPRVLFVASMNNYLNPMVPVARRLVKNGVPTMALMPAGSERWPAGADLPREVVRVELPGPLTMRASAVFAEQRAKYRDLWGQHASGVAGCFRIASVDLWPLVGTDVERFVKDYFAYAIACIELARDLADRLGVTSVAVARLRRATECSLAAGFRSVGVPVTMLMHGHVSNFPERRYDAGDFSGADRVCVWGEDQRRQVLESAWPPAPGRVHAVGNPAWDSLVAGPRRDPQSLRADLARRLDLDPRRLWSVLTSQTLTLKQFAQVVEVFANQPRAALIVKVHPAEDPAWYRQRLDALRSARVLPHAEVDLHDLLCASDMTMTFSSTTNLESLILGTPVVTYVFGDLATQDRAVYLENFGLPLARRPEDLASILSAGVADPEKFRASLAPAVRRAIEHTLANHADAGATDRVAAMLATPRAALR